MKKRVLSAFMALALCLTLLPTAALADELGPVDGTSTVETAGADAEAEAKAKAGAEAVAAVQAMIDALPDELTEENAEDVSAKLGEIDAAMAALGDEERAALDLTQYQAAIAALAALAAAQGEIALYADDTNKPHNGKGTTEDPYQITSTDEMEWFRDTVNAGNTKICAKLMNDLKFSDKQSNGNWTWTPIGNSEGNAYVGMFDGNGYEIKEIRLVDVQAQSQTNRGLFGWIGTGGKVQDLAVSVKDVGNSRLSVSDSGLLSVNNAGTIERCSATISNALYTDSFGMIAYENRGNITDCLSYVSATGNRLSISGKAAGIARTNTGAISNCFFRGSFRTGKTDYAIAENKNGSITNCYYRDANNGRNGEVYIDGNKDTGGTVVWKSTSECNSGEVAWLLNNSGSRDAWRMNSKTNGYPSLKKTDGRVNKNQDGSYNIGDKPHMHGDVEFTKVAALSDIKATGNYYIDAAVDVSSTWEVNGDVVLCLNGQTVTAKNEKAPAIKVSGNNRLKLLDCKEGKITGSGGTSILVDGGSLTLGGKAQITGNAKNILLTQDSKISFDSLDPSAKFGISVENQENLSGRVAVTDATGGQYFGQLVADGFKNDGSGFQLYLGDDGKTVMLGKQSAHTHCICGDSSKNVNGHTHGADITFQPWTETDKLPTSGNYYLTRNVTLTKNATLQNANVCLNGYTVTLSDVGRIMSSGTTQLTDCSVGGKGKLESYPGKANGGVAISGGSKFYLYGGTLNGVKVEIGQTGGGTFNMYGGKITGNTKGTVVGQSKTGGNQSAITINMYGGEISGNHISENQGGGVFVGSGNQFNMYGGTIQNNSAVDGGGVYIAPAYNAYSAGEMTICGDAVIQGNKAGSVTNNVSLPSGKQITISGKLVENAKIGVTTRANLSQGNVNIATATDAGWVVAKNFTSDNSAYDVGLVNDGKTVQLQVHSHQWKYTANGATITAACKAPSCLAPAGGSVTINKPAHTTYGDGQSENATLTENNWQGLAVNQIAITYKKGNDILKTAPTDVGEYAASITVGGVTASVTYEIGKATPMAKDFVFAAPGNLNYDGNSKIVTVSSTKISMDDVTVKYYDKDGEEAEPKNAGDYTVKVSVAEGANYNATTDDLTTDDWKFTIGKATQTIIVPTDKTIVKDGIAEDISDWATVAGVTGGSNPGTLSYALDDQAPEGVSLTGNQLTVQPTCTAAQFSIKVTAAETDNYNAAEETFTVIVVDKATADVTITGLPGTVTYGQEFTLAASQTGDTTSANKKWTWDYDQEYFKQVGPNANTEAITLQAIKAGTPSRGITATYESGTHKGSTTVNAVVAQKEVTVSGITAADKVYDGNDSAMVNVSTATITGKETGDDLTVSVAAGSTFDSADAGSRTVTLDTLTLGGTSAGNYTLATSGNQTTATANITVRDLTVKPDSGQRKTFGDADPALTYAYSGEVSGETPVFDGALSRKTGEDVGTYNITKGSLELKDSGTFKAANYNLVLDRAVVTFEITKGTYGGSAPTKTVNILKNYAGVQTGTLTAADFFTTAPAEAKITNAVPNSKPSSMMSLVSADSSGNFTYDSKTNITAASDESWAVTISSKNYMNITGTLTFKLVDKTDVSAQITFPNGTLTYNGTGQKYEKATISGVSGGTWNYTYVANSGTGASLDSAGFPKTAGTYTVTAKYEDDAHIGTKPATLTVSKATPTGAPKYTAITTSGKTLADAGLTTTGSTLNPNAGTLVWVDNAGNVLSGTTAVAANTTYKWLFTPADTNYTTLTGSIELYHKSSSGGGGWYYTYYTIKATAGTNGSISPSGWTSVRDGRDQTFTITPDKGYAVAKVLVDGKSVGAVKSYTFKNVTKDHTIEAIFMKSNGNPQTGVFVDVAEGSYYEEAIDWAVEKGITNGVSSNMFAPNDPCTRAQIVTFLWRVAGSPAPKSMSSFTDVPADAFYAKAVAWAVENGITSGTGEGKFSPNSTCTRAQAVTFLYRASGSPAVSGSAEFSDVSTTAFYADAVAWAAKKGITTGIGGGLFGSDNDCTRGQIVTFLWRAMAE